MKRKIVVATKNGLVEKYEDRGPGKPVRLTAWRLNKKRPTAIMPDRARRA